ncbi:MAG: hypothetical protein WB384_24720 [Candidatus Sulfotelmatobacter sp.]
MGISPVIYGAEAPPRLCDPPCSEKQAGIGPISPKPELLTMGNSMAVDRVAQAATDCRGGRSVHVVKAMLPICEQKIYVWSWSKSESGWSALETTLIYAHSR